MSCRSDRTAPRSVGRKVLFYIVVVLAALSAGTVLAQSDTANARYGSSVSQPIGLVFKDVSQDVNVADTTTASNLTYAQVAADGEDAEALLAQDGENLSDEEFDALFDAAEEPDAIGVDEGLVFDPAASQADQGIAAPILTSDASDVNEIEFVERPEEDLLIVEVVVDENAILDPGVIIYADENGVVLPLSIMAELFQFQFDVNPSSGEATGWFIEPENTFDLRRPYNNVTINGEARPVPVGAIENHFDDIFVRQDLFEEWFPVTARLNFNELRLYVTAAEELPFQAVANRRARWEDLKRQTRAPVKVDREDLVRPGYKKFSPPVVQMSHNFNYSDSQGVSSTQTTHSFQSRGDVLGLSLRTTGAYQTDTSGDNRFDNFTFTLEKNDYLDPMFGRLAATEFAIGDVSGANVPLATSGVRGRGVRISNQPLNFVASATDFGVEGDGPIGHDVELYQDERLIDFQTIGSDGLYNFRDVRLRNGFNFFKVILYGPNGEREERFERFYLGNSNVEKGQFLYEAAALQSTTPLFDPDGEGEKQTPANLSFRADYGVTDYMAVNAGLYQGEQGVGDLRGASAGVSFSAFDSFWEGTVYQNEDKARSYQFNAVGNITPSLSWNLRHLAHNNYEDDIRSFDRQTQVGLFKQLNLNFLKGATTSVEFEEEKNEDGLIIRTYRNRLSGSAFGLNLTNQLEYIDRGTDFAELDGQLTGRYRLPFGNLRGRLNYKLRGNDTGLQSLELQLQRRINNDLSFNATYTGDLGTAKKNTLRTGLDWELEKLRLGVDTSVSDEDEYRLGVNLGYSLIPQSITGDYKFSGSTSDFNNGQIAIRPFLDENMNGVYDENEELVADVEFLNRLRGTRAYSNESGIATLGGLSPNVPNRITINEETLPDIYLTPARENFFVLGKSGFSGPIDFPMAKLGEVSGVIYTVEAETGDLIPLENIQIYLIDENGEVYAEAITEFDGFYLFPSLPMGSYEMFFPKSTSLDAQNLAEGSGPRFTLTFDAPEVLDGDLVMTGGRVYLRSPVREAQDDDLDSLEEFDDADTEVDADEDEMLENDENSDALLDGSQGLNLEPQEEIFIQP